MALSDMFGLLGGGTAPDPLDIYGDLFSKEQKAALAQRSASEGLLRMAGAFGKAAQPSRMPTSFMGALGEAAGALAGTGDEAAKTAITGMKTAEDVRTSRANREIQAKYRKILEAAIAKSGIDPASPQGQQIVRQTLANPAAAGGDLSGSTGTPGTVGDFPTGAGAPQPPGAPQLNAFGMPPPQDLTRFGIPLRPGQSPPGAPAEAAQSLSPLTPRAQLPPNMTSGRAGAGMPPVNGMPIDPYDPNFGFAPPPPQQNTGLLPPPPGASPGQSLQGPGVLASLAAGGGAPPPFQQALSTLTGSAAPGAPDLSNFTAADAGGGGDAGDDWQRVKPLIRKYESGNRNINQQVVGPQGGYNPSVGRPTGPSSASGYYQMIDPTWRAAARKVGIDTNRYPRAIDAPEELQDKAAEALYREQGLRPWAPYNRQLAAAIGYQGARGAPDLSNMAGDAGGGGDDAAPAGGGVIPGLNMTPEQLGLLNAYGQLGGLKSPFDSLLETYYKSPKYLREKAITEKTAEKEVGLAYDPKIEAAKAAATQKYIQENATHESQLKLANDLIGKGVFFNKETKRIEPITNAAQAMAEIDRVKEENKANLELVDTTLTFPGEGRPRKLQMTRAQAAAIAQGKPVPELGIPAMTGIKMGQPVYNPTETALGPIEAKAIFENHQLASDAATTIETNKQARALLDAGTITGFGADKVTALTKLGNALGVTGRDSREMVANTESYLATTAANVGRMIKQFGAGTGLSDADRDYAAQMAAGKVTLDETSIRKILDINDRASLNIINRHNQRVSKIAPGATMTDLNVPAPEPYKPPEKPAATTAPATTPPINAPTATGPGGQKLILRNGQWVPQ